MVFASCEVSREKKTTKKIDLQCGAEEQSESSMHEKMLKKAVGFHNWETTTLSGMKKEQVTSYFVHWFP